MKKTPLSDRIKATKPQVLSRADGYKYTMPLCEVDGIEEWVTCNIDSSKPTWKEIRIQRTKIHSITYKDDYVIVTLKEE